MSLFNFNPSGFLGSGAFALDPSKFNFSNISAPTVVDKPDPLDIVSDKTPEVKVEVDEPTGGMLFTQEPAVKSGVKPTPVVEPQAPTVMPTDSAPAQPTPIDLGMNFGTGTALFTGNIPTSFDTVGDMSQVAVDQEKVEQDIDSAVDLFNTKSSVLSGLGLAPMGDAFAPSMFTQSDRAPVQTGTKTVNGVEVPETVTAIGATSEYINIVNNILSSDKADEFVKQMSEQTGEEYTKQDFVESLGLTWGDDAFTVSGKYGGFSLYEYDEDSDQYVKTLDKESSAIDAYLPAVSNALQQFFVQGVLTAGLGSFTGINPTTIKTGVNLVNAVEEGDVVGAVTSALDLADLPSPTQYVQNFIDSSLAETTDLGGVGNAIGNWAFNNSDHIAAASVKLIDKMAQGEDLGDSLKSAGLEYFKDGGGLSDLIPDGSGFDFDTPEFIEQIGDMIVQGASDFNRNVIKPLIKTIDQGVRALPTTKEDWEQAENNVKDKLSGLAEDVDMVIRALPTTKEDWEAAEDWYHENLEDPAEQAFQYLGDKGEEFVKPIYNTLRNIEEAGEKYIQELGDNLPEVPDIDMPDFGFENSFSGLGGESSKGSKSKRDSLVTAELYSPELVEGFDLSNPFFRGKV